MKQEKKITRRRFLTRTLAFILGCVSAITGIFALLRGRKIEPFLSLDSMPVLKRFGTGHDLLENLQLSNSEQAECALRIVKLKRNFDKNPSLFKNGDFSLVLKEAVEKDFKKDRIVMVAGWILSEKEVGVFIFNKIQRYGKIN